MQGTGIRAGTPTVIPAAVRCGACAAAGASLVATLITAATVITLPASAAPQTAARQGGQAAALPPPAATEPKPAAPPAGAARQEPAGPDGRCDACGGGAGVRKVCVAVPKEREIKKTCWGYKCEDFCVPGPSEHCGHTCGHDACGHWWFDIWKPTCAEVRTRKVPVKTEVKRKVPGVEWKVEERCAACRCGGDAGPSCAADAAP